MIRRILAAAAVLLLVAGGVTVYWYQQSYLPRRYSPAAREALAALDASSTVEVVRERWVVMRPRGSKPVTGLIFYPGGEVEPEGYSEPLLRIAGAGYLVVNVPMPLDLAVLAPDRADAVVAAFPEIRHWVIGGHSLGGSMAARYVARHPGKMAGLLLWDAYAGEEDDLAAQALPVRQLHRLDPDGKVPVAYRQSRRLLPKDAEIIPLAGASHINYGRFITAERFRNAPPAAIPIEVQHERVASLSIDFLERVTATGDR